MSLLAGIAYVPFGPRILRVGPCVMTRAHRTKFQVVWRVIFAHSGIILLSSPGEPRQLDGHNKGPQDT